LKFDVAENGNEEKNHILRIEVIEKIKDMDCYFDVIDRSKGFLWFYNFVMKLEFNPKVLGSVASKTVYLLDEPGSYLHQSAQEELCKKLVSISKNYGSVIYCTHSHKLLNPNLIPLNSIYIVEKDTKKKIKATPLPKIQTKVENTNAFQPVLEALQTPAFESSIVNEKVIVVEGIYDKYAVELMVKLDNSIFILPGTSADSIIKNIQYLNGFNKTYIAIWDNDDEGEKSYKRATKFFGEIESEKFDLLPLIGTKKRRMEEMFSKKDLDLFRTKLGLNSSANYESIISTLFYSDKKTRQKILASTSKETNNNFLILKDIIDKRMKKSQEIVNKVTNGFV
jgi:5S rRNA maturation endonuclease (ribonuclease M5)